MWNPWKLELQAIVNLPNMDGFWDLNSGPLEAQQLLLPTEPFHQS